MLAAYAVLLVASHAWMLTHPPAAAPDGPPGRGRLRVEVPAMTDAGPTSGRVRVSVLHYGDAEDPRPPLVCLHGSPGSARNFEDLGRRVGDTGRRVYALDLPGFGRTRGEVPSYSILAHARASLAVLDELGVPRAHLVAWSMGGGVALHLADLAPDRVASVSLVAAIGVQQAEGSGSYAFEHLKYAALGVALGGLPELVPHFGALGHYGRGRAFVRNFWDTDQRPLEGVMQRLETPTLILHGRDDFLVPAWAAERSHALIGPSRLELSDFGHFLPLGGEFGQLDWTLERLGPFLERHDAPGIAGERARVDGTTARAGLAGLGLEPFTLTRVLPWWVHALALVWLALRAPRGAAGLAGALVAGLQVDFGLGLIACLVGAALRTWRAERTARLARRSGQLLVAGLRVVLVFVLVLVVGSLGARFVALPAPQWLALAWVVGLVLGRHRAR